MIYNAYFGIRVTDLDRSLDFYTRLFSFKEKGRGDVRKFGVDGGIYVHLEDPISKQTLELDWYPPESRHAVPYFPGEGLDHIAFVVDDVEQTFDELVSKGVLPTDITPETTDGYYAYVKDPDGNWIELMQSTEPRRASLKRSRQDSEKTGS